LNSRGWFYPSSDVATSVNNLLVAFNDILVRNVSGSSVATNTTSLQNNSKIYQATVESDWKGHLRAYPLTTDVATGITSVDYVNQAWDLAEQVSSQQQNSRAIYTSVAGDGKTFIWANLDNATKAIFTAQEPNGIAPAGIADNDVFGTKVVEYLRGSGDCEDGSGTACVSGVQYWFRRRNLVRNDTTAYSLSNPNGRNVLGDVSNSNPWYVSTPLLGMSDVDYPGYNAFRVAHNNRINVLYVGVNDGMLHAVRTDGVAASADTDALAGGSELFAYIPSFVLPVLPQLASTSYSHHFSADGSPFAANADIGGTWKTVLASGANKGGKGYFLLDITDPVSFSAASVLWEFTNANDADMNYTFNMPVPLPAGNSRAGDARQIVHMNDNSWDLIVGNGYPEDAGKSACLFIISLTGPGATGWELGTNYHKLCAGATSYTLGALSGGLATNGLSTPTPFDLNGDGKVDVVYAGDLNGNMWRFNVASSNPASWAVDYAGQPLFVAKNDAGQRQPIIAPPEVTSNTTPNPTAGKNSILVLFGTGKFIETTDQGNTDKQSFYAVWDREDSSFSNLDRSYLYEQKFDTTTSGDVSIRVPHDSAHPKVVVGYCLEADLTDCSSVKTENSNKMGWYWDMPDLYERMTGHASLSNNVVLFNTFIPGIDATGALDPCQYGGSGWIMGLDAVNGYMENYDVFDVNRDGVITAADVAAAGVKVGAAIGGTTFARSSSTSAIGIYSPMNLGTGASEGKKMTIAVNTGENVTGRVSWFEITD
jgi:type IV pilus assembly protein PilY1